MFFIILNEHKNFEKNLHFYHFIYYKKNILYEEKIVFSFALLLHFNNFFPYSDIVYFKNFTHNFSLRNIGRNFIFRLLNFTNPP